MRWTIAKLVLLAVAITAVAGAFSQLFVWFFQPFIRQEDLDVLNATVFATHGLAFAAWTLAAFAIGAFLGMLIRRIVPAIAAGLGVYLGLALLTWGLRSPYPVGGFWPMQFVEGGWLLALSVLLMAATVWLVRRRAA